MLGRCNSVDIYERFYPLGEGTYGKVFKARHRQTQEIVALKKIIVGTKADVFPETFLREIRTLLTIRHPNIVRLKEIVLEPSTSQFPLIENTSRKRERDLPADHSEGRESDELTCDGVAECPVKHRALNDPVTKHVSGVRLPADAHHEGQAIATVARADQRSADSLLSGSSPTATYLVFEYCSCDLFALQQQCGPSWVMPRAEVKCVMQQLLRGLDCLHQNYIIHRDIKLPNLFLTNRGELKIGDLGLAREFEYPSSTLTPDLVTLWYRAPELFFGLKEYTSAVDIWAAGCVMGELLLGTPLLPGANDANQMTMICNLVGVPTSKIWPGVEQLPNFKKYSLPINPYNNLILKFPDETPACRDLLGRLLICDPEKRITAREALQHPYFTERPLPCLPVIKVASNTEASTATRETKTTAPRFETATTTQ